MISQTAGLMIPPQIAQRLAFLQRSYRAFPIINIVHTISVSHTSAGETDKTGMKVRQSLCQIGAQPVLPAFKCILWEKRNHIQGILPSHLRTNGQHGIRSIRRCRQYSLLFFHSVDETRIAACAISLPSLVVSLTSTFPPFVSSSTLETQRSHTSHLFSRQYRQNRYSPRQHPGGVPLTLHSEHC